MRLNKFYVCFRKVLAAVSLLTMTAVFFIPAVARGCGFLPRLQLVPAILAGALLEVVVLAILVLLFGRLYCSILCPLGILQDLFRHCFGHLHPRKGKPTVTPIEKTSNVTTAANPRVSAAVEDVSNHRVSAAVKDVANFRAGAAVKDVANFRAGAAVKDVANFRAGAAVKDVADHRARAAVEVVANHLAGAAVKDVADHRARAAVEVVANHLAGAAVKDVAETKSERSPFEDKSTISRFSRGVLLRYSFLALFVLAIPFGLTGLVEPYGIFGRFLTAGVRRVGEPGVVMISWSLGLVAFILAMTFVRARWWCNRVCPVGTLLGLLARVSLFRVRINDSACVKCGACAKRCDKGALTVRADKSLAVDLSSCVVCGNCLTACPRGALSFWKMSPPSTGS